MLDLALDQCQAACAHDRRYVAFTWIKKRSLLVISFAIFHPCEVSKR
jgi:hypothetical protein